MAVPTSAEHGSGNPTQTHVLKLLPVRRRPVCFSKRLRAVTSVPPCCVADHKKRFAAATAATAAAVVVVVADGRTDGRTDEILMQRCVIRRAPREVVAPARKRIREHRITPWLLDWVHTEDIGLLAVCPLVIYSGQNARKILVFRSLGYEAQFSL